MKFWKSAIVALVVSTGSMLAGSYIHARAVDGDYAANQPKQLNYLPVLGKAMGQQIQLSPELRAALLNEIEKQTQAQVVNAVIVITPQGEVLYMGTMKNSQSVGPGTGGKMFRNTPDNDEG